MFRFLGPMFVLCLVGQPSFGDDSNKVLGTWKLVSYETEVQATGEKEPAMGQNPTGYVAFNAEGRVFLVLTGEARKPAKTSLERAELFTTLIAYTGTYRVEGDKWTTRSRWRGFPSGSAPNKSDLSRWMVSDCKCCRHGV